MVSQTRYAALVVLLVASTLFAWESGIVLEDFGLLEGVIFLLLMSLVGFWRHWELRRVNAQLQLAKAQAESAREEALEAMRTKSEFLARMSHEIRTPITAIIGLTDLMTLEDMTQKNQEHLRKIMLSTQSLLSIVNDILDFSKIEAGKLHLEMTTFSLRRLVGAVMSLLETQAEQKGLQFEYRIAPDIPEYLEGDTLRVEQVLMNLVSNAIKFTPQGKVSVQMAMTAQSEDHVMLQIDVEDTGIGIDPQGRCQLFEPFAQADLSITRRFGGSGLGLAITKLLVEAMEGRVWIESAPGGGSRFSCTMEFLVASRPDVQPKEEEREMSYWGAKVLLVEDEPINREIAKSHLQRVGVLVDEAQNGVEAVEKMAKNPYDLVFMDVHMPMLDGLEATRTIRRMGIETPIIALSAHVSDDDREKSLQAGMQEHLTKPFRPRNLYEALERFAAPAQRFHAATIHGWSRELPAALIESSDELEEMWGDFQSFAKKLKAFVLSKRNDIYALFPLLEAGSIDEMLRINHTIKGLARLFAAHELLKAIGALDTALKSANLEQANEDVVTLVFAFEALKTLAESLPDEVPGAGNHSVVSLA